jgi:uncharacterized protein YabE (DUF348 family)
VTPGLSTPVEDGMMVRIRRSHPFTLVVDGRRTATRAYGPTVGDALAVVGAAPVGQDYTVPPSETPFEPGMVIRVVRVVETLVTKRELIPYSTTYRFDPTLAPGTQRVIQAGQDGVRERQVLVRYEDGVEVQRTEQAESILQPATPCLVAVGTPGE